MSDKKFVQLVFFEEEEILSPREFKEKYFLGIKRSDTSNRPYSLDEVKKMLETGDAFKIDPNKRVPVRTSGAHQSYGCQDCPLGPSTHKVRSSGDWKTAKAVFVGEAPGENEEVQGIPFVGRAGQLLRETLKKVGIEENQVVFANVCRCRPPNNRAPVSDEINRCLPFLEQELEGFKGLVVLLGATAVSAFLDKVSVSNVRGYGYNRDGKHFFVTYHPAYILRNQTPQMLELFEYDLKKVKKSLDFCKRVPYNLVQNERELTNFLSRLHEEPNPKVSFDIETNTLYPLEEGAKMLSTAFSLGLEKDDNWCIPLEHPESPFLGNLPFVIAKLKEVFADKSIRLIGHNGKFDLKWLKLHFGIEPTTYWFDTQVAQYLYNGLNAPQELKTIAWKYTPFGGYGLDRTDLMKYSLTELCDYNVLDAVVAFVIQEELRKRMLKDSPALLRLMEDVLSKVVLVLVEMESHGLTIHEENLTKLTTDCQSKLTELELRMHNYPEIIEIETTKKRAVNFGSPQQLAAIFKTMGLETSKKTPSGAASTSYEVLQEMQSKHPLISDIMKYRELDKVYSTYLGPYLESFRRNGTQIRGEYMLARTATGRLACQAPNLQNIPHEIQPVFMTSRDYLLEADYSQLEYRVMAMYSKDPVFIEVFQAGKDLHEETRKAIFGANDNLPKLQQIRQRVQAKSVNFGIIYGVSGFGLAQQLGISEQQGNSMIDVFFSKYPQVRVFMEQVRSFVLKHGYFETFFGRRRYFKVQGADPGQLKKIFREAMNFPVQSTARDLVFDAEGRIWEEMHRRKLESKMCADVHDSTLFDVVDEELPILIEIIKQTAEDFSHIPWVNVPLKVDLKIGKIWGQLEEV